MKNRDLYLIGISSGILYGLSFPGLPFFLFAFIAFIPILFALQEKPKRPYLLIYLMLLVQHWISLWWIGSWQSDSDPFLLASGIVVCTLHPFLFLIPFIIYNFFRRKLGSNTALWLFPLIYSSFEWLRSFTDMAFPWLTIGYSQTYFSLWSQIADIGGVWLLSFLILFVNVLILKVIFHFRIEKSKRKTTNLKYYYLGISLIFIIPMIYGYFRLDSFSHNKLIEENPIIRVGIIQPNINPWRKWDSDVHYQIEKHKRLQDSLLKEVRFLDLAIWSETAFPFHSIKFNSEPYELDIIFDWLDDSKMSLLTGFTDIYFYKPGEKRQITAKPFAGDTSMMYQAFNAAIMLNPSEFSKRELQIYRKMKLTPFSERLPFVEYVGFALNWLEWGVGISNWGKGSEQKNLILKNHKGEFAIAPIICIESIYPDFVRKFSLLEADLFVVITNDAWFNYTTGPTQHYTIAAMRAIENRKYLARCANSGISGFIKPTGQTLLQAEPYEEVAIAVDLPILKETTIYTRFGDWLPYLSVLTLIIAAVYSISIMRKQKAK